jgi:Fe-S-cluster containining protein
MREIEKLKEQILKEYPRLTEDSSFSFRCHAGVPCFNECCGDVNIFLTPYDIIRLKNNLGISSTDFLKKYTLTPFDKDLKYPVILLQMGSDEKKKCPFVGEEGCRVYPDRPWSCRMYPLGLASPGARQEPTASGGAPDLEELDKEFYFLLEEGICQGFKENKRWTISEWLRDQGINDYVEIGRYFKELTTHKFFREGGTLTPEKVEMFFVACYDIDRFRRFVFDSSLLNKFEVDNETIKTIKTDDVAMLKFAYRWLRFALFNEPTMKIKEPVLDDKKKELIMKGKLPRDSATR